MSLHQEKKNTMENELFEKREKLLTIDFLLTNENGNEKKLQQIRRLVTVVTRLAARIGKEGARRMVAGLVLLRSNWSESTK
jgi:hypothetical protein